MRGQSKALPPTQEPTSHPVLRQEWGDLGGVKLLFSLPAGPFSLGGNRLSLVLTVSSGAWRND